MSFQAIDIQTFKNTEKFMKSKLVWRNHESHIEEFDYNVL